MNNLLGLYLCVYLVGEAQANDPGLITPSVSLQDVLILVLHLHFVSEITWMIAGLGPSIFYGWRRLFLWNFSVISKQP